ncbi:MAG: 16S rRNA (cytidine(1402)-2'-O)-methyltransferase [Actinobacteria bacterium]|nr:16S rRNA (cytidine(1402)-2'-O)-methyltransferase [Actinomycetota bacterium]MCB8997532.1 16S rRNA (cytidine(1402)-2'-O)-methyltransferase [Actinomycetota bacterium]MCB9414807.1 16S rRNA (cytidine(1402)-2'-O)-methyltransferase [Actinomycetota bacterium]MCB9423767.1 16S rRNA (cytidine(1402)-2'-O)-methyltransferase [Actinomycetota bacterium]HRY09293.1 16S rRNA (cytidine(1402)-2'-O)-methyltransferase [Candidatus Nanopelagicales bacterium]
MSASDGILLVAATPLGNPADASSRLRDALASADVVAAEDTRKARRLAADLGVRISGKVISHYDAVESERAGVLAGHVADGRTVLVVTDAGMPSVSDPGLAAVRACIAADLPVTCLPGPSAVTTALVLSGLPSDRFVFEGFLPRRDGQRRQRLRALADEPRTIVLFESPRRLQSCLADMVEIFGADRPVAVCRELTKTYEEVLRGSVGELVERVDAILGEVTVVVGGAPEVAAEPADLVADVEALVAAGARRSEAIAQVAGAAGVSRRELYALVVKPGDGT